MKSNESVRKSEGEPSVAVIVMMVLAFILIIGLSIRVNSLTSKVEQMRADQEEFVTRGAMISQAGVTNAELRYLISTTNQFEDRIGNLEIIAGIPLNEACHVFRTPFDETGMMTVRLPDGMLAKGQTLVFHNLTSGAQTYAMVCVH